MRTTTTYDRDFRLTWVDRQGNKIGTAGEVGRYSGVALSADDARVAHLNTLLQQVAATDPANVSFVKGPAEWCNDPAISSDLGYRWDGVHVYKPGAKLIYETIAPALLAIPRS